MTNGDVLHTQKVAGISGSEAHLLQLLPDLRARGWDVRFLMLHEDEPGAWEFAGELRARGVPLDDVRLRADVDPLAFREVVAYLSRTRPQILHTHLVHADLSACCGRLTRVPLRVSTKHGFNEFRQGRSSGSRTVAARSHTADRDLGRPRRVPGGNRRIRPRRTFTVVHYGIAPGPPPPPPSGGTEASCVGRLIPIKGLHVLLRAFESARARGAGVLTRDRRRRAARRPSSTPRRRRGDVPRSRRAGHAGVRAERDRRRPSRGEGFGMVALEAAERGRAAIVSATSAACPRSSRTARPGLVVPPGDAEALAEAIVELAATSRALDQGFGRARSGRSRSSRPSGARRHRGALPRARPLPCSARLLRTRCQISAG